MSFVAEPVWGNASTVVDNSCRWCGACHTGKCPLVSAIEYHEDGSVKRVEFHASQPTQPEPIDIAQTLVTLANRPGAYRPKDDSFD